jgi:hypothetical protein
MSMPKLQSRPPKYSDIGELTGQPTEKITERMQNNSDMQFVEFIFLNKMEREFDKIKQDANLSYEFRKKLTKFYANCQEIKSYVDRPRGTFDNY